LVRLCFSPASLQKTIVYGFARENNPALAEVVQRTSLPVGAEFILLGDGKLLKADFPGRLTL
jgi:hypothetical protein